MDTNVQPLKCFVQNPEFVNKHTAGLLAFSGAVMTYRLNRNHRLSFGQKETFM